MTESAEKRAQRESLQRELQIVKSTIWTLRDVAKDKPPGHGARFELQRAEEKEEQILESVREHHAGLQSLRSMRRIEARRRKASALQLRFSQSLASRRQRFSQAMVRSTIQRFGRTTNPFA